MDFSDFSMGTGNEIIAFESGGGTREVNYEKIKKGTTTISDTKICRYCKAPIPAIMGRCP